MRMNPINKRTPYLDRGWKAIVFGLVCLTTSYTLSAGASETTDAPEGQSAVARKGALLSIHDMITDITVESLRRRIDEAKNAGAKVIVFNMDTPGGLVTSSIAIADMIRELDDITTVAWVNPNAHSGGSLVAVACDEIVMSRSSRIGDSQVIMGGPGGAMAVPEELQPKAYTPVLSDFRQSAKLNGYSEVMCEAFVLPEREVWWIENVETGERRFVFREDKIRLVDGEDPKDELAPKRKKQESDADKETRAFESPNDPASVGPSHKLYAGATGGLPASVSMALQVDIGIGLDDSSTKQARRARLVLDEVNEATESDDVSPHTKWKLVERYHDFLSDSELDLTQPIVRDDMLLEMSAGEATAFGFCKAIISDRRGIENRYDLTSVITLDPTWSEELAFWMTSMYVRGFLMLIILLGAYVEFHTPGVGVPGLVALIALAIFVGAPYLTGLANVWELVAIVLGVALLALELFVIPGFGLAGISGVILLFIGLLGTFVPDEPGRSFPFHLPTLQSTVEWLKQGIIAMTSATAVSLAGMVILSRYLPKTTMFRRIAPANPAPSDVMIDDEYLGVARIGDVGVTVGPLFPNGKARFGATLVDVVSQGEYVDRDQRVEVIEHRGNRIVVRALS